MTGTSFSLEVQPKIPERLSRLAELSDDLFYTWERQIRSLYMRLDAKLWTRCGHNPKVFMRRVSQQRLEEAAHDSIFMEDYNRALSIYDTYRKEPISPELGELLDPDKELVAYFCAEFGFHESLPIYSGGLGILAGDHCKAASDMGIPFVAVGLLYRQGYFTQTIDAQGNQIARYTEMDFSGLPINPAKDSQGQDISVDVMIEDRNVKARVWHAKAGRINLYLLDTYLAENTAKDREITHQLYGGGTSTRIQQEIVLGIGGVRALRALGLTPTAWHINEGHAAFQILERCRDRVKNGANFDSAMEIVAAGTVYTTHTPVPAGHDIFEQSLIEIYFKDYINDLGIDMKTFLQLGSIGRHAQGFNMTTLALHGSRIHNGVSRIHGAVASQMEGDIWPQIPHDENPMGYVTNGVHLPTFLAKEWMVAFDLRFGGEWRNKLRDNDYWNRIYEIPDHAFWSLRQSLKSSLLEFTRRRVNAQLVRNNCSQAHIRKVTKHLAPDESNVLILGFARRFATYKRATLLFSDPERLARLLNDPERPVLLMFAGKAHPSDIPGQELIRTIHEFSQRPEFVGKILLLEGYDLSLSRKLVNGVDVWLNTPEYPMEASGTSGQKAGINGVLNLSVLDGWWGEGFNGYNGWAITPHGPECDPGYRDQQEGNELMSILEDQVIPMFYRRNGHGYSEEWVMKSKSSMASQIPQFNAQRMVMDYVRDYYAPASRQRARILEADTDIAKELSNWKQNIAKAWPKVKIRRVDEPPAAITTGENLTIKIAAALGKLSPEDVSMECLIGTMESDGQFKIRKTNTLTVSEKLDTGEMLFSLDIEPPLPGLQHYKVRLYPNHPYLCNRFETGLMLWV
jgi:starch phosphorylase